MKTGAKENHSDQKKLWVFYTLSLLIYFLDYTIDYYKGNWEISQSIPKNLVFVLFHLFLFLFNNHVLIPRFFYKKRYWIYALSLITMVVAASFIEEKFLEKLLYPISRGSDRFKIVTIYFYLGEILSPFFAFSCIKIVFDNIKNKKIINAITQEKLMSDLKFLKSQIQPHILFNSLNAIYDASIRQSVQAPEMILKLSNLYSLS